MSRRSPREPKEVVPLTPEQWQKVIENRRLIHLTIREMYFSMRQSMADAEDWGLDGLISAVRHWEEGRSKFSYFATFCIRRRIQGMLRDEALRTDREAKAAVIWLRRHNFLETNAREEPDLEGKVTKVLRGVRGPERKALTLRFGLDGGGEKSFPALAPLLGLRGRSGSHKRVEAGLSQAREVALRGGLDCD